MIKELINQLDNLVGSDDFGMPGSMVHFIERFDPDYIPLLIQSENEAINNQIRESAQEFIKYQNS
jgi:hypothetical protein